MVFTLGKMSCCSHRPGCLGLWPRVKGSVWEPAQSGLSLLLCLPRQWVWGCGGGGGKAKGRLHWANSQNQTGSAGVPPLPRIPSANFQLLGLSS